MLLEEFPPEETWFEEFWVQVDLGFFGIEKDYACKGLSIPYKNRRRKS
jgi:hypothetical protein